MFSLTNKQAIGSPYFGVFLAQMKMKIALALTPRVTILTSSQWQDSQFCTELMAAENKGNISQSPFFLSVAIWPISGLQDGMEEMQTDIYLCNKILSIVDYRPFAVWKNSRTELSCITETLCQLKKLSFSPLPYSI